MLSCEAQSLAASSPSDSPERKAVLRRAAPCSSPLAQSFQALLTSCKGSAVEKGGPTVSVHSGSCGGSGKTSRRQELESEQRGKAGEAAAHVPVVGSNNSIVPRLLR